MLKDRNGRAPGGGVALPASGSSGDTSRAAAAAPPSTSPSTKLTGEAFPALFGSTTANSCPLGNSSTGLWPCARPGSRNQEEAAANQNITFEGSERGSEASKTACPLLKHPCLKDAFA